MNKKNILLLLTAVVMASCHDDNPYHNKTDEYTTKYWLSKYFIPNSIQGGIEDFKKIVVDGKEKSVMDSTKFYLYFDHRPSLENYSEEKNKAKFLEYARAYHENGDTLFSNFSGYVKPVGIKSLQMYIIKDEKYINVSENFLVKYKNDSLIIANHYSNEAKNSPKRLIKKKLSELTEYDYKWIPVHVNFEVIDKTIDRYWLRIQLENGAEDWYPYNLHLKDEHKKY